MLKEGAEPLKPREEADGKKVDSDDDDDPFEDVPAPRQPAQLAEYSDEDDEAIIKEVYVSYSCLQSFLGKQVHQRFHSMTSVRF